MPGAGDKGDVAGGFLYAVDPGDLRKTRVVLRRTRYAGSAGDVVYDERQLGMLCHICEMTDDPGGARFVIVGRCKKQGVCSETFSAPGGVCRGERVVPANPGDHLHAGTGADRGKFDNGSTLCFRER